MYLQIGDGSNTGTYGPGTYYLNGGSLVANHLSVGYSAYSGMSGTGTFSQSAGTNSVSGLYLGEYANYHR